MRNLFLLVCLLVSLIFISEAAAKSCSKVRPHTLTCKEWLGNRNATHEDAMFLAYDIIGTKGTCNDFFPEWTMRSKIERQADKYVISIQQCNMRNIFASNWNDNDETGQTYCGDCQRRLKSLCLKCDSWNPPAYDHWGGTATATFTLPNNPNSAGFKASDAIAIDSGWGGFVKYKGCIIYYNVGDQLSHNISSASKFHPQNVRNCSDNINCSNIGIACGYVMKKSDNCTSPTSDQLIGCVSVPPPKGPDVYHSSLVPKVVPKVASENEISFTALMNQYNSKFDQPVIVLISGRGASLGQTLALRYKYEGDTTIYDDKPICAPFPGLDPSIEYCAQVPADSPNSVCACKKEDCSAEKYMGDCVPRPTPKQSNLAVIAQYQENNDTGTLTTPGVSPIFVKTDATDGALLITDAQGTDAYLSPQDGQPYLLDQGQRTNNPVVALPFVYKKLPLPLQPLNIRDTQISTEGNSYVNDEDQVYGLKFSASIAQTLNNNIKTIGISTPATRQDRCFATTVEQQPDLPEIPVPAGMRDRSLCCPNGSVNGLANSTGLPCCPRDDSVAPPLCQKYEDGCVDCAPTIAQPCKIDQNNDGAINDLDILPNNAEAALAVCPGQYMWPNNSTATADSICLSNKSDWNWPSTSDNFCTLIKNDCGAHTVPSLKSGYATWNQSTAGSTDEGECKQEYGVNMRADYSIASGGTATAQQLSEASSKLDELKAIFSPLGLNIPQAKIDALSTQYGVNFTKTEQKPTRTCGADGTAIIKNSCIFISDCPAITNSADFTGNVTWPAASGISLSTNSSHLEINTQLDIVQSPQVCMVEDDNGQTVAADDKPKRACVSVYKLTPISGGTTTTGVSQRRYGGTPELLYRYWSSAVQGGCISN